MNRRVRRQSSTPVCMDGAENASRACLPDGVNDAPTSLVNCVSSMYSCVYILYNCSVINLSNNIICNLRMSLCCMLSDIIM